MSLPDPHVSPTMRVRQVADVLGVSKAVVYEAVRTGQLPSLRVGHLVLIPTSALVRLLDGGAAGNECNPVEGDAAVGIRRPIS